MNTRTALTEHIKKFVELNPSEEKVLQEFTEATVLNQFDFVVRKSQVCHSLYFVKSGCLRLYFVDAHSTEHIIQFAIEGWWITDYSSLIHQFPSDYFIQATEKSEIIKLDKDRYKKLNQEIPQLETYFNKIMQINLAATQNKSKYLRTMSNEELYNYFSTSFPDFMERVPKSMVESYLGIFNNKQV